MVGGIFSDDIAHEEKQASLCDEFVGAGIPNNASDRALTALLIEQAALSASETDMPRIAEQLQELALEACDGDDDRAAMAARFGITVAETA